MRKTFILFVSVLLLFSGSASAQTFHSLELLQAYLLKNSPGVILSSDTQYAEFEGVVSDVTWCGANNHYNMTLLIDEEGASKPVWTDTPMITVHFRLHVDPIPFQVGDTVTVFGELNSLYSSYMVPYILAKAINGTEDY